MGWVKRFLLHCEADVKDLPDCCVGSIATVSETDNEYICTPDGWKHSEECVESESLTAKVATLSEEKVDKTTLFGGDVVTKNLDAVTEGAYINIHGEAVPSSTFCYGYIDVSDASGNITVDVSKIADSINIGLYRDDYGYIGYEKQWAGAGVYDIPITMDGVAYYGISCKITDREKISVSYVSKTGLYGDLNKKVDAVSGAVKTSSTSRVFGGAYTAALESVIKGAWINENGSFAQNENFCHGYIDISNAIAPVIVDASAITDTLIINLADENKQHISNIKKWAGAGRYEIAAVPFNAAYICISCKVSDEGNVFAEFTQSNVYERLNESAHGCDAAYANAMTRNMKFIKGLHLDCGRKYFSPTNIKTLIDRAHAAGLNTFQIYFSDHNGFRFGLDDMELVVEGKTYDLSIALGDGRAPTDGSDKWLTQAEMDEIIAHAQAYGMEIIPAFDMPDHARAIADAFPDITLTNKHGIAFYIAILKKYAAYFASKGCMYYNICGDESSYDDGVYNTFMRLAMPEITKFNMTPLFYNDVVCKGGRMNPPMNSGGIVLGWIRRENQTPYSVLDRNGYRMINASGSQYYWVLGVTTTTDTLVENIRNSNIFYMADRSLMYNIVGAMYHIWCDHADADGADNGDNVLEQTEACIAAFGEAVNRAVPGDNLTVVKSPDGYAFRIDVSNDGTLSATRLMS